MREIGRRRLLEGTAVGLGLATAGCLESATERIGGNGDGDGSGSGGGSEDSQDPNSAADDGTPEYTDWLPAPAAFETDHYVVDTRRPSEVVRQADEFDESARLRGATENYGELLDPAGIELRVRAGNLNGFEFELFVGGFDPATVKADITGDGEFSLQEAGEFHGFSVYQAEDGNNPVAISEEVLLISEHRRMLDPVIEARDGDRERYVEASEEFRTIVESLGTGTAVKAQTYDDHQFDDHVEGTVGSGSALRVRGAETEYTGAMLFDGEATADAARTALNGREYFGSAGEVDVSVNGDAAVATATLDTAALDRTYPYFGGIIVESRVTEENPPEEPPAAQDLEVVSTVGRVTDEGTIGSVSSVVKLAAGSDAVDMSEVAVEWVGPSGSYDLQAESSAGGADGRFALSPIAGQTDSFPVLTEPRDRFQLVFDLGEPDRLEGSFGEELPEGATAELRLVLPKDNSVREQLVVPSSLADRTAGTAVQL